MATRSPIPVSRTSYWFALLLAASVLAFWPAYVSRLPQVRETYVHLHTLGVVAWMALLIVQPLLVQRGKLAVHRALGQFTYFLVPYIIVTSTLLAHSRFSAMPDAVFAENARSLYSPAIGIILFAICYGLAILFRRDMPIHRRFMVATALPLIDPIMGRLLFFYTPVPRGVVYQLIGYGLTNLVLVLLIWLERDERRGRWAFPSLLALFFTLHLGSFTLAQTQLWFGIAAWFRALPLS